MTTAGVAQGKETDPPVSVEPRRKDAADSFGERDLDPPSTLYVSILYS